MQHPAVRKKPLSKQSRSKSRRAFYIILQYLMLAEDLTLASAISNKFYLVKFSYRDSDRK